MNYAIRLLTAAAIIAAIAFTGLLAVPRRDLAQRLAGWRS